MIRALHPQRPPAVRGIQMNANDREQGMDNIWQQICAAGGFDPQRRLAARQAILGSVQALECSFYRADENDPDAEEEDLGDARILFDGPFQAPAEWDAQAREEFFGDDDPALFFSARIECEAAPASAGFFVPEIGDYLAVTTAEGGIEMYYVHDCEEDETGNRCVLIRDDEEF